MLEGLYEYTYNDRKYDELYEGHMEDLIEDVAKTNENFVMLPKTYTYFLNGVWLGTSDMNDENYISERDIAERLCLEGIVKRDFKS